MCSSAPPCCLTMASSRSPISPGRGFSFCKVVKALFVKAPRPMVLIPVLQIVVQASAAFTPLQSAAGGLLKVMEIAEVRRCSSFYPHNASRITIGVGQKAARNKEDMAELATTFSKLITMLQGLQNADSCPAALRQRIEMLARSAESCPHQSLRSYADARSQFD